MLIHVVTFTFKEEASDADVAAFHAAASRLADDVPFLRTLRNGPDLGERPTNAGYGLVAEFDGAEDFYAYVEHPAHKRLVESSVVPMCASWKSTQFLVD